MQRNSVVKGIHIEDNSYHVVSILHVVMAQKVQEVGIFSEVIILYIDRSIHVAYSKIMACTLQLRLYLKGIL